jgi:hypothetical protein
VDRFAAGLEFLIAIAILLWFGTKSQRARKLSALGHWTIRTVSAGQIRVPDAMAIVLGIAALVIALIALLYVMSYLYGAFRAA